MGILAKITGAFARPGNNSVNAKEPNKADRGNIAQDSNPPTSRPITLGMDDTQPVVLSGANHLRTPVVEPTNDGGTMHTNSDGSYIVFDAHGEIIRTQDVLHVKREFARDRFTKQLMIKRFGTWTKPDSANLEKDGTLSFSKDGIDVVERLNGVHMHFNQETRVTILTHNAKGLELVKGPDGNEITKRQTTKDVEFFCMWRHGTLVFESKTFYSPRRHEADTPNGKQPLVYVSRYEKRWLSETTTEEKFHFRNTIKNNERSVTLSLQLSTGLLMLKGVTSVATTIAQDMPVQSTFELKQPTAVRIDLPGHRETLDGITALRLFDAGMNIGLAFKNETGREYMVLTAKRPSPANRAGALGAELDRSIDIGMQAPGLLSAEV